MILHGYLGSRSDLSKNVSFVQMSSKNLKSSIQLISLRDTVDGDRAVHDRLKDTPRHAPVTVTGIVKRKERHSNSPPVRSSGRNEDVEINVKDLQILNEFPTQIMLQNNVTFPPEQRHLQLRARQDLRNALAFRAEAANVCRKHLTEKYACVEIETPLLFKSTPEGAREFLVPTRNKGYAYALPQSPQQYKQILMASGIPGYFQLAKCFRDEDLRADRQPEFTQVSLRCYCICVCCADVYKLDVEMSFANGETIMMCIEDMIRLLWSKLLGVELPSQPFARLAYHDAMARYGSDKPDLRLGMEVWSLSTFGNTWLRFL